MRAWIQRDLRILLGIKDVDLIRDLVLGLCDKVPLLSAKVSSLCPCPALAAAASIAAPPARTIKSAIEMALPLEAWALNSV